MKTKLVELVEETNQDLQESIAVDKPVNDFLKQIGNKSIPDGHLQEVIKVLVFLVGNDAMILAKDFVDRMRALNIRYFALEGVGNKAVKSGLLKDMVTAKDAEKAVKKLVSVM